MKSSTPNFLISDFKPHSGIIILLFTINLRGGSLD